eukprot:Clim_evm18s226 gene=Clim_evmTU18s226
MDLLNIQCAQIPATPGEEEDGVRFSFWINNYATILENEVRLNPSMLAMVAVRTAYQQVHSGAKEDLLVVPAEGSAESPRDSLQLHASHAEFFARLLVIWDATEVGIDDCRQSIGLCLAEILKIYGETHRDSEDNAAEFLSYASGLRVALESRAIMEVPVHQIVCELERKALLYAECCSKLRLTPKLSAPDVIAASHEDIMVSCLLQMPANLCDSQDFLRNLLTMVRDYDIDLPSLFETVLVKDDTCLAPLVEPLQSLENVKLLMDVLTVFSRYLPWDRFRALDRASHSLLENMKKKGHTGPMPVCIIARAVRALAAKYGVSNGLVWHSRHGPQRLARFIATRGLGCGTCLRDAVRVLQWAGVHSAIESTLHAHIAALIWSPQHTELRPALWESVNLFLKTTAADDATALNELLGTVDSTLEQVFTQTTSMYRDWTVTVGNLEVLLSNVDVQGNKNFVEMVVGHIRRFKSLKWISEAPSHHQMHLCIQIARRHYSDVRAQDKPFVFPAAVLHIWFKDGLFSKYIYHMAIVLDLSPLQAIELIQATLPGAVSAKMPLNYATDVVDSLLEFEDQAEYVGKSAIVLTTFMFLCHTSGRSASDIKAILDDRVKVFLAQNLAERDMELLCRLLRLEDLEDGHLRTVLAREALETIGYENHGLKGHAAEDDSGLIAMISAQECCESSRRIRYAMQSIWSDFVFAPTGHATKKVQTLLHMATEESEEDSVCLQHVWVRLIRRHSKAPLEDRMVKFLSSITADMNALLHEDNNHRESRTQYRLYLKHLWLNELLLAGLVTDPEKGIKLLSRKPQQAILKLMNTTISQRSQFSDVHADLFSAGDQIVPAISFEQNAADKGRTLSDNLAMYVSSLSLDAAVVHTILQHNS